MSDSNQTIPGWKTGSKMPAGAAGHRNLQLWNLLNQASEIIDDIEVTLRSNRQQARESARAAADATSPEALRLIELVRDMHAHALRFDEEREHPAANRDGQTLETKAQR